MKEHGFARGSQQSRRDGFGSRVWACRARVLVVCAALLPCACSGSTDVVGVLPADELPPDVETGALEGAASSDGSSASGERLSGVAGASAVSIVAGMRVNGWDGRAALDWPFNVSLEEFFEEGSRPGRFGQAPRLERKVIAVMGPSARAEHVRVVAPAPEIAERLRDVFAEAEVDLDADMVARVMRDRRSDEYRVALGSASCVLSPSHHGGPCAQAAEDGFEHP